MKAKVKEHEMFYEVIMNHIPNNIRYSKLVNLKGKQDINKSIGKDEIFF